MAATAAEFSNPRNTADGLRRVFIRWFRVVNAIAGEIERPEKAAGLQRMQLRPEELVRCPRWQSKSVVSQ